MTHAANDKADPHVVPAGRSGVYFAFLLAFYALLSASVAMLLIEIGRMALGWGLIWFDPIFFVYNLVLAALAVAIAPTVAFFYSSSMREAKEKKWNCEIPKNALLEHKDLVEAALRRNFRFRSYFGSLILISSAIALGVFIILLLKPVYAPGDDSGAASVGVNYALGANFLLLGPYIEFYPSPEFYHRVIIGLTAFQFGFLGAYAYFIMHLARSYFTLDLSPGVFIDSVIRMAFASILSLVIAISLAEEFIPARALPIVTFIIGFFPNRGLLLAEEAAARYISWLRKDYQSTALSKLSGMSYAHEVRLNREGFDNVENISHADPVVLALNTGFSFQQLDAWIGEAWLRCHLGDDYADCKSNLGVMTKTDLIRFFESYGKNRDPEADPVCPAKLHRKLEVLRHLCNDPAAVEL